MVFDKKQKSEKHYHSFFWYWSKFDHALLAGSTTSSFSCWSETSAKVESLNTYSGKSSVVK